VRYFVVADNGQMFGPADIPTLNVWIAEGRVIPTTLLQLEGSQSRMAASTVPGLTFGSGQTYASYTPQSLDNGQSELKGAWIAFAMSFFCFCVNHVSTVASGFAIFLGYLAYRKGNSTAVIVMVIAGLSLAFHLWATFLFSPAEMLERLGIAIPGAK